MDIGLAIAARIAPDLPHLRTGDLAHRKARQALHGVDDAADLVAGFHLVIDLVEKIGRRAVARAIGSLEDLAIGLVQRLVDAEETALRNLLADRSGDALGRIEKGVILSAPPRPIISIEALGDAVNGAQQDAALAKDVGFVFEFQRCLEGTW